MATENQLFTWQLYEIYPTATEMHFVSNNSIIVCEFLKEGQKVQSSVGPFWVFGQIQVQVHILSPGQFQL